MKFRTAGFLILILSLLLNPTVPAAQRHIRPRAQPRDRQVWVPPLQINDEVFVPGFWRPASRRGYIWVEASRDEEGRWHPGYWEPRFKDAMDGPAEIAGYWGPDTRTGFTWLKVTHPATLRWGVSFWSPLNTYKVNEGNMKWVPGYRSGSRWIPGYWRPPERESYTWVEGYYAADGRWQEARWVPTRSR